jgi:hypothetical protein
VLEVLVLVVALVLVLAPVDVLVPVPVLVVAPVPEVLVDVPGPEVVVVLPAPPLPVDPGTHWALASQMKPCGQSRAESAQSCLQVPLEQ